MIKFRGKDADTGDWRYGYYVEHQKVTPSILGWTKEDDEKNMEHFIVFDGFSDWNLPRPLYMAHVDPGTVGQSIGRHDKDWKEIFVGDVIRDTLPNGDTHDFLIKSWPEFSCFRAIAIDSKVNYAPALNQASMNDKEIIGNIYDNPELRGDEQTVLFRNEAQV
jgi:uncharacterized phage protein (TIGR01671 family)